jgi:hypothetical protein
VPTHSTYHIYAKKECHKLLSTVIDTTKERRSGPTVKQLKAIRAEKNHRKASGLPSIEPDDTAFFIHRPYLAFHVPPRVLYTGNSKRGTKPAVLIHEGCFWRSYKLQVGPSIGQPGVLDPRGVVAWKHNGGDKKALKADEHKLKGYKVRTWRLWGETGKEYVHEVKRNREAGEGSDPDVLDLPKDSTPSKELKEKSFSSAVADEVVHLRWTSPLSRQTRCYHFHYRGIEFQWKGTGTVKESRRCGLLLRFNHLKLVAKLPLVGEDKTQDQLEMCLGKFTSSVAKFKSGTLELYDAAIVRLCEEHMPSMLAGDPFGDGVGEIEGRDEKVQRLKKSTLYQVFVATAMCMIKSEKEKRHTVLDFIGHASEGGGAAGG